MPRSGIPVICSRATLSCDSSYLLLTVTLRGVSNKHCLLSLFSFILVKVTNNFTQIGEDGASWQIEMCNVFGQYAIHCNLIITLSFEFLEKDHVISETVL